MRLKLITEFTNIELKWRAPYTCFFEQEIYEQPETIMRATGNGSRLAGGSDSTKLGGLEQQIN